jgi:FG-GAP-like repeat/ASPIC and UnbV
LRVPPGRTHAATIGQHTTVAGGSDGRRAACYAAPGANMALRTRLFRLPLLVAGLGACGHHAPPGAASRAASGAAPSVETSGAGAPSFRAEFEAIARRLDETGPTLFFPKRAVVEFTQALQQPGLSGPERAHILVSLAHMYLSEGDNERALDAISRALEISGSDPAWEEQHADFLEVRAIVHLRMGEVENCIARHNAQCCLFPLEGGAVHVEREPARLAREDLLAELRLRPDRLGARWLLNLCCMALGEYPDAVPPRFLLPDAPFASEHDVGRFRDVAHEVGVDAFNRCGGAIAEDFDGDGRLDIVTSTIDPLGPLHYYRNAGPDGFEDRSAASRLDDQLGGLNCIGTDYDNDGDVDVLVLRGAWWFDAGQIRNSLLRNDGHGTFTDVTYEAGLAEPARPTQAAAWLDYDLDGDLDLYVVNESRRDNREDPADYPSQLFRNEGDGTFTDVAAQAGVTDDRYAKGVCAGDYDNDGDTDLYVSNIGPNRLYRNNGDGTFTDVAPDLGVTQPAGRSFATWFFDYDNDGWLDLFVAAFDATLADLASEALGRGHRCSRPCLYHNNGDGTFTDVAPAAGLDRAFLPMGANFGDLDNDGWLDIYLATGDPEYRTLMPNVLLRNDGGKRFEDVTRSAGVGHLQKGHGVAFADFDGDGDQDLFHQLGGFFRGDAFHNALFVNPGHGNAHLALRLVGTQSNRAGFGARIRLVVREGAGTREIHRAVGSVSSFGGSPFQQEIGLGHASAVERLEITWPRSGRRQVFEDVPLNARLLIREDADGFEVLPVRAYDLGAAHVPG